MSSQVEAMIARFMGAVPHVAALGVRYTGHGVDWAELALPPLPGGLIDTGAIFALVDSAAGFAVSVRRGVIGHATLDLRLDHLAPPPPGATVTARMTCYRVTAALAFVRGAAHAGNPDRPVAAAMGTFMFTAQ